MSEHDMKKDGVDRRSALQSIGAGIGLSGLGTLRDLESGKVEQIDGTDSRDRKKIRYADLGEEGYKYKEVPREWHELYPAAENAKEQIEEQFLEHPGINGIGIGTTDKAIGSFRVPSVHVYKTQRSGVDLPDSVNGIDVTSTINTGWEFRDCSACTDNPPGGMQYYENHTEFEFSGTLGWKVSDGGSKFMLTAAHVFSCDKNEDIDGWEIKSTSSDGTIGYVQDHNHDEDWALIDFYGDFGCPSGDSFAHQMRSEDGPTNGHMTKDGLRSMKDDGTGNRHRGAVSCYDSGPIDTVETIVKDVECQARDGSKVYRDYSNQTVTRSLSKKGDSGAFFYNHYYNSNGACYDNLATHLLTGGGEDDKGNDISFGIGAYYLDNNHYMEFNPDGVRC